MSVKYTQSLRSLMSGFAMLALTVIWLGANTSATQGQTVPKRIFDFTGDNRTDFATVAIPAAGPIRWRIARNPALPGPNQAFIREFDFGLAEVDSITASGDYGVGNTKADPTVYRNSDAPTNNPGVYYVGVFPETNAGVTLGRAVPYGNAFSDIPTAEGDYDGDGKIDFTVIRVINTNLNWFIMSSATGTMRQVQFGTITGTTGPTVFPGADFNGDGRDELVYLFRNAAGTIVTYQIGDAVTGAGVITRQFGNYNTDVSLAPNDYTGDGRADFVAVRETQGGQTGGQAVWYILNTAANTVTATAFGIADPTFTDLDSPVRGDYDGDGRHDIAVWRPSNQTFYWIRSGSGGVDAQKFGQATDTPISSFASY